MYTQVKRYFAEDLDVWPVVIARLSNFAVFCVICNNTLQVSRIRYPPNGAYVMAAALQLYWNSHRHTHRAVSLNIINITSEITIHTKPFQRNGNSLETACRGKSPLSIFLHYSSSCCCGIIQSGLSIKCSDEWPYLCRRHGCSSFKPLCDGMKNTG